MTYIYREREKERKRKRVSKTLKYTYCNSQVTSSHYNNLIIYFIYIHENTNGIGYGRTKRG